MQKLYSAWVRGQDGLGTKAAVMADTVGEALAKIAAEFPTSVVEGITLEDYKLIINGQK